jgi:hypothetical protein
MNGMADPAPIDPPLAAGIPADVATDIETWQGESGCQIVLDQWLDLGNTRARVAVAAVRTPDHDAKKMIVKFCPPDRTTAREPKRHTEALATSPASFTAAHLVQQPIDPSRLEPSKWWLLFQEIAGGSLRDVRPLAALVDNIQLPAAAVAVVESLMNDWNPTKDVTRISVREFFAAALGTRFEPDGPILRWAAERELVEPVWIRLGDSVVPNPAAITQADYGRDLNVMAVRGNAHGDLHLQNILLPMAPVRAAEFRLIDLSNFAADAPLARDPVHLLLSTVLPALGQFSAGQKVELLSILAALPYEQPEPSLGLEGHHRLALGVYTAGQGAVSASGMADDWADQTALALSATALMFATHPAFTEDVQDWAFELAARSLGEYLTRTGQPIPGDAEARFGALMAPDIDAAGAVADACRHFDGSRVTISVANPRGSNRRPQASLARSPPPCLYPGA